MAGTGASIQTHVIGSTVVELSRANNRTGAPFSVRISTKSNGFSARNGPGAQSSKLALAEGPSCIFVGPIETASKETLEALYLQARDAYYSGKPLIVDDMFDRVEVFALASVWILFLAFGSSACLVPIIYTVGRAYQDAFNLGFSYTSQASVLDFLAMLNCILFMALGSMIGYPIASASVGVLQGLWRNDLVALKGVCPNCGEEVFAFVRSDQSNSSPHRADCHVCESSLIFRTKVESISRLGRRWVYGRIYLVPRRGRGRRQRYT